MSIVTKGGDAGLTSLMYGRRIAKSHPRVEAYGCVDELNAALGVARATATQPFLRNHLARVQENLVQLMGELATAPEDLVRFGRDGFQVVTPELTALLDQVIAEIESQGVSFKGWATPGATPAAAALDLARTVCRRAERRVCGLSEAGELTNPEIVVYLNRLSDLLWLLARWAEVHEAVE
ncbi:MAG: cob(I)yrinic acid a,c-diamide adenosyltransferase [Verrucomicrobia bacterium]|jgi:cob(I)alamin adenosyltransferase|nr:cob(I)yrinic acid a,c-diamide adenosyltransferase [Verrucomicrobiota bacterium]